MNDPTKAIRLREALRRALRPEQKEWDLDQAVEDLAELLSEAEEPDIELPAFMVDPVRRPATSSADDDARNAMLAYPFDVQYAKVHALYMVDGTAWTKSRGYPVFCEAHPCSGAGTATDTTRTIGLTLPARASRKTAVDQLVGYVRADGTLTFGGTPTPVLGHIVYGINEDKDLPIIDDSKGQFAIRLWTLTTEPDVEYGYITGWKLCSDYAGLFLAGYLSTDADFDAIPHVGGSKTHLHTASSGHANDPLHVQADDNPDDWAEHENHHHPITVEDASNLPPYGTINLIKWNGPII